MIFNIEKDKWVKPYFKKIERKEIEKKMHTFKGVWYFDWVRPFTQGFEVYGMITEEFSDTIEGLIALKTNYDEAYRCVDVDILESAPHNKKIYRGKVNRNRIYSNVGKCLVAFACQYSFDRELEGYVQLTSKTSKLRFYSDLGFEYTYGQNMGIHTDEAVMLVSEYFQGGVSWWKKK